MIDATHPKGTPHRLVHFEKRNVPRRIRRTKGGLNSKLHAVVDEHDRPLILLLSEGQACPFHPDIRNMDQSG